MSNVKRRITAAAVHVWAEQWRLLDGKELLEQVLTGPLAGRVAVSSSFGAEAAVLLHMVAKIDNSTPVIFLDTGKLFSETLTYRDQLTAHLGLSDVRTIKPDAATLINADPDGDLYQTNHDACCEIRKIIPNAKATSDFDVIITGRKKFHGFERSNLQSVEKNGRQIKINPLVHWSASDIEEAFLLAQLPRHPLVDAGYSSIGCSTCTRKTTTEENVRAGRWCGQQKTECGIHNAPRYGT